MLNQKNNFTWEKNIYSFPWLLSKGSSRLIFRGLIINGATICKCVSAVDAWPQVLPVVDISKPVSNGRFELKTIKSIWVLAWVRSN